MRRSDRSKFPLQRILREILIQNDTNKIVKAMDMARADQTLFSQLVKYCTIVVASLPIVIIYPFLQKYFVAGIMVGSIKE